MFRHFHVIITEYYICASENYTSVTYICASLSYSSIPERGTDVKFADMKTSKHVV
jgi:hypothetical protein